MENGARAYRLTLLVVLFLLVVSAYFPFRWDPPRIVNNDVTRTSSGYLQFGLMNRARTPGTPAWLEDARGSGTVQVKLDIEPALPQFHSLAAIMMLARDFWHTDFAVGQSHSDLLVWLRRPGSDANGNPPFTIKRVIRSQQWNTVDVAIRAACIRIDVDGRRRLTEALPVGSLNAWGPGQLALGGEVHGGGAWQGAIRQAEVRTPGHTVDYLRPGALSIPVHFLYLPDHVAPFPPLGSGEWIALCLHLLSFIVVGFLIVLARKPPIRAVPATGLAAAFAVLLAAGKFLFDGRHTAAADIVVQTAGAALGTWLAWRHVQGQRQARPEDPVGDHCSR
jgi:VanZ family protein